MQILIKNKFYKLFEFLSNRPPIFYITISIITNLICLFVFNLYHNPNPDKIYFIRGDAFMYVGLPENLYKYGTYTFLNGYTSTMPGMTFLYIPLRFIFSQHITLTLFIIIQTLLSAISIYLLARIAEKIFNSKKIFLCVFLLYLFSTYVKNYNNFLLTESLAVSTLIISLFYLLKFSEKKNYYFLVLSGIFITWSIFLRPFLLPVFLIFALYILIFINHNRIKNIILFLLPFIIAEAIWISRNYNLTNKFIPLQTAGPFTDKEDYNYDKFLKSFGFSTVWFSSGSGIGSEATWFSSDKTIKTFETVRPNDDIFPKYIFTDSLNIDSLKYARYCLWQEENDSLSQQQVEYYHKRSNIIFRKFINSHSFFTTQIRSRFMLLFKFMNQSSCAPLKCIKYPFNVLLVFFDSFINYFVILSGFLSLLYLSIKLKRNFKILLLIGFVPAFIFILFPLYLQFIESRELTLAYPFLCILSVYLFFEFYKKYKWKVLLFYFICFSVLSVYGCMNNINW